MAASMNGVLDRSSLQPRLHRRHGADLQAARNHDLDPSPVWSVLDRLMVTR
jgi:hypothetical protein